MAIQQPLLRTALEQRLSDQQDLRLVGDSLDGETALRLITAIKPDIAIIEDSLPVLSGRELAELVREEAPATKIVLLLPPGARERIGEELLALVDALLLADDNPAHLVQALRTVALGQRFICALLGICNACEGFGEISPVQYEKLSERERDILGLMVEQQSAHQISRLLGINYRELHRHREAICQKLNIDSTDPDTLHLFAIRHRNDFEAS